ncbi:hypothetical protein IAQ61_011710 [Plenodomus lingam]|uniref:MARVEL domain-containing protein n=1 Tax=Leptosphaeria maculans (strain JN3 / isolate v23.1.3 / race Av1-4-5-6-7-8) TaxID=985895 RepID=E5AAW1_LEPMJ|nr:hypothetical protein LEMA_P019320.1 [Plenodomus lingam JN3]KAH9859927.1 hypothetical protein IAQ61_011710 [Plenodomus lingam]CBY00802.1 hypothetical protein LEMA_P019320.1 [Plenodomus lingam JN3]
MRVPQSYIQKCKVVAHSFQAVFIFVAAVLTIAVMTKDGSTGGSTKYFFAMCFFSIPAIIYLTMVPMWTRAARFASAYAFLAVDALLMILWFAAFIAVAMWNSNGIKKGAQEKKVADDDRNCSTFAYGSESKCKVSKASVGMGVVIFILFGITTGISSYYFVKYKREGVLPYESNKANPHYVSGESPKDNAWSTEIETAQRNSTDSTDQHTDHGSSQQEDEYALLHSTETDEGRHPGRPLSWGSDRNDGYSRPVPSYAEYRDPTAPADALSPGGYEDYRREAGVGNIDAVNRQPSHGGSGYSFGDR